jgi:hypothetical protein
MAKARVVVADTGSQEVAELRRTVNHLLLMLETMKASLAAGVTANNVLTAISDAIITGTDNNSGAVASLVTSGREIKGSVLKNRRGAQRVNVAEVDLATFENGK